MYIANYDTNIGICTKGQIYKKGHFCTKTIFLKDTFLQKTKKKSCKKNKTNKLPTEGKG